MSVPEVSGIDDFTISDFCDDDKGLIVVNGASGTENLIVDDTSNVLIVEGVGKKVNEVVESELATAILS